MGSQTTTTMRNTLCDAYKAAAQYAALYSTVSTASAQGTELVGGSPAYARKLLAWGNSANGGVAASAVTLDVAPGGSVQGAGVHNTATVNQGYLDGVQVPKQDFSSQGTYTLTLSFAQA